MSARAFFIHTPSGMPPHQILVWGMNGKCGSSRRVSPYTKIGVGVTPAVKVFGSISVYFW